MALFSLPISFPSPALEFRGLIDAIADNNTLLLLGMPYKIAKQKRPVTAAECSVSNVVSSWLLLLLIVIVTIVVLVIVIVIVFKKGLIFCCFATAIRCVF